MEEQNHKYLNQIHNNFLEKNKKMIYEELVKMGISKRISDKLFQHFEISKLEDALKKLIKINNKYQHSFIKGENEMCDICEEKIYFHQSKSISKSEK